MRLLRCHSRLRCVSVGGWVIHRPSVWILPLIIPHRYGRRIVHRPLTVTAFTSYIRLPRSIRDAFRPGDLSGLALALQNGREPDVPSTLPNGPPIIDGGRENDSIERDLPFGRYSPVLAFAFACQNFSASSNTSACMLLVCPEPLSGALRVENFHRFTLFKFSH
jgi:hypothetical protein